MILSGKDVDIDGLMLQLELENVEEMRRGVTQQLTDQIDQVNRFDIGTTL